MKPALFCFKIISLTLLFMGLMLYGFTGNSQEEIASGAAGVYSEVRVGITLQDSHVDLSFENNYRLIDRNRESILDISPGRYSFYKENEGIKIVDRQGEAQGIFKGPLLLQPVSSPASKYSFRLHNAPKGSEYRGNLEIIGDNRNITVVNILDIEYYLKGVVPCEMPTSWGNYGGMEALKAQAVAARTYALYNQLKRDKGHIHVCDTEYTQVYRGKAAETPNTDKAIEETKGELLYYNGSLVQPYYYATSGGYTERSENVWNSSLPYLNSVHDPYDDPDNPLGISNMIIHPHARWKTELPASSITGLLKQHIHPSFGSVKQVKVASTFESGRVEELLIEGDGGNIALFKDEARTALGLRSQLFTVKEELKEQVWVAYSVNGSPRKENLSGLDGKWVINGNGTKEMVTGSSLNALNGNGSVSHIPRKAFIFEGKGWGHGVGMSQNGAYNRAREGYSYQEILSFYYPGTSLTKSR